jgi:hypothetical protein
MDMSSFEGDGVRLCRGTGRKGRESAAESCALLLLLPNLPSIQDFSFERRLMLRIHPIVRKTRGLQVVGGGDSFPKSENGHRSILT